MPGEERVSVEQVQAAAATLGVRVGEDVALVLPLITGILARLDAVPDERLQGVEPLLVHSTRRRGTA